MALPGVSAVHLEAWAFPGALRHTGPPVLQEALLPAGPLHIIPEALFPGVLHQEALLPAEAQHLYPGAHRHTEAHLLQEALHLQEVLLQFQEVHRHPEARLQYQGVLHHTEVRLHLPGAHLLHTEAVLHLPPGLILPVAAGLTPPAAAAVPIHPAAAVHRQEVILAARVHQVVALHVLRVDNYEKDYTLNTQCGFGLTCSRTVMGSGAGFI